MTRTILLTCAVVAALCSVRDANSAEKRPVGKEQLTYEVVVTNPGTKSQGWHGILYDDNGQVVQVEAGKTVNTDIGELVGVAPVDGQPWKPYGAVPATPGMENINQPDAWAYKLYKTGLGSRCPSWRGDLLRGAIVVKPHAGGEEVKTSLGPFIWLGTSHGWAHKSWKVKRTRCG